MWRSASSRPVPSHSLPLFRPFLRPVWQNLNILAVRGWKWYFEAPALCAPTTIMVKIRWMITWWVQYLFIYLVSLIFCERIAVAWQRIQFQTELKLSTKSAASTDTLNRLNVYSPIRAKNNCMATFVCINFICQIFDSAAALFVHRSSVCYRSCYCWWVHISDYLKRMAIFRR